MKTYKGSDYEKEIQEMNKEQLKLALEYCRISCAIWSNSHRGQYLFFRDAKRDIKKRLEAINE